MASSDLIDINSLLQPISEDAPTGHDIRENASKLNATKHARQSAKAFTTAKAKLP